MTEDSPVTLLRREYDAIARQLEGAPGNAEREAAKREIIAYFKKVDGMLGELTQLKDEIRQLVDRYKQLAADTKQVAAPEFTGQRPAMHADHIGASTFIEKGWSLISLGDHAGAISSLQRALQLSPGETQAESLLGWAQMLHEDYDDALGTFQKVLMKEPANSLARINVGYICLKKRIFGEAIEHLSKAIRLDNDKKATLYADFYLGLVYLQRGPPVGVTVGRVTAVAWPSQQALAVELAQTADEAAPFPGVGPLPDRPIRVILAPTRATFDSLTRGRLPGWSEGAAFPEAGTIVLLSDRPSARLSVALRHELAHLALRTRVRRRLPLWFEEGYAAVAAGEWGRLDARRPDWEV